MTGQCGGKQDTTVVKASDVLRNFRSNLVAGALMKILIVDDDALSLMLLSDILSPFGTCDTADNGIDAIALFEKAVSGGAPYNLICLDILMPEMDGHQVLKQIRSIEDSMGIATPDAVKIIMVTSESDVDIILKAYNIRCDVYVTKPITRHIIVDKLRFLNLIP
jgi:two-component system, chemotaxis family, chemotaxis protein CheY